MAGNFQFGVVSGQNQNVAALANFNIDFSIVKFAAPPEYNEIGLAISPKRRTEAEDGHIHTVARKLALLLCDDLPEIPNLVRAYGIRATEIAKDPRVNPRGTSFDGAFQEHIGIDGTSLWASATSGKGAVAVHLLACMLSRMWKGRATAIWTEMVAKRKAMLQERLAGDKFSLDEVTASAIQISRDQLSEWDASARAWLESADIALSWRQTQARLILDNLGIELPSGPNVYKVVMKAWKVALQFMENIVIGMPQAVKSGEVLLALSSWHLYPDLEVLYGHTQSIKQNDPLIARGGVVTIGLQNPNIDDEFGILWSLPLSHLQYYGKPVMATGSINTQSSRVTMDQLLLVGFGCVTNKWVTGIQGTTACAKLLLALQRALDNREPPGWLKMLFNVAVTYLESTGKSREDADRLISFGRRRCPTFLAHAEATIPIALGLTRPEAFIGLLQNSEAKIKWLRKRFNGQKKKVQVKRAQYKTIDLELALIRYPSDPHEVAHLKMNEDDYMPLHHHPKHPDSTCSVYPATHEWASLAPVYKDEKGQYCHRRWLSTLAKRRMYHKGGYEPLPSVTFKRCAQLKEETGEDCGFVFGNNSGGDIVFEEAREKGKMTEQNADTAVKEYKWLKWQQSHPKVSPVPLLLGYQLPERPIRDLDASGFGVWGAVPHLRTMGNDGEAGFWTRYRRDSSTEMATTSSIWEFLARPLSLAARSLNHSANLEKEKEKIAKVISSELDSNRAFRNVSWQIPVLPQKNSPTRDDYAHVPPRVVAPGMRPTDPDTTANGTQNFTPTWDCMDSDCNSDCWYKWYIPTTPNDDNLSQSYLQVFAGLGGVDVYVPAREGSDAVRLSELLDLSLVEVIEALEDESVNGDALLQYLKGDLGKYIDSSVGDPHDWVKSLNALKFALEVYSNFPDAHVELSITKSTIHDYYWSNPTGETFGHARSLSCIAAFESGDLNIHPKDLKDVMAISAGSSLYITQFLWSDPLSPSPSNIIRRSIGNVGKRGIAFLISPKDPSIKEPGYDSWQSVQHNEFDGKLEDNFPETSLHLSFTGYELALNIGQHGLRDKEVYYLQAVVQAYERGVWVADLDVLDAINNSVNLYTPRKCHHTPGEARNIKFRPVTSIDCWAELLDPPENLSIVRAKGNWLARLATAVVAIQKGRTVLLASGEVCWACVPCGSNCYTSSLTIIC